jgi:hypothetical protein
MIMFRKKCGQPLEDGSKLCKKGILARAWIFVAILIAVIAISCSSTGELARQVQSDMIEHFKKEGVTLKVKEDLMLVHSGGNEYTGVMTITIDGETAVVSVNVVSDGETFIWKIEE